MKPKNAYRILEGAFYDTVQSTTTEPSMQLPSETEFIERLSNSMPQNSYTASWLEISKHLITVLGMTTYKNWFMNVYIIDVEPGSVTLRVISTFRQQTLMTRFENVIIPLMRSHYPTMQNIHYKIEP